jgi:mannitol/fructose-specific phosphotransferase system IIA component (Ntr-type)
LTHAVRGLVVLLTELLTPGGVLVPIAARDKSSVIAELARHLTNQSGGNYQDVLGAVEEREAVLSTGIGFGVAIPHARSSAVQELTLVCGVSPEPVPFDSIDGEPVRLFFLIVGPESSAGQHVKVLSRIARLVRRDNVRDRLSQARTPQEFYDALVELESQ